MKVCSPEFIACAAVLLAACSLHPTVSRPMAPVEVPDAYGETAGAEEQSEEALPDRWWEGFGDPELNHLVETALARNLQMGAAWARLEQSEALIQGTSSAYWPQISTQLDVARRRQVAVFGALGRQEFEVESFGLSVPVSYELDLWNRVGHGVAASGLDALATRDDVEALALTLAANVTEGWLGLLEQRALVRVLEGQLEVNRTYEELITLRFTNGLGSALDVYQQRQRLRATEAQLAQARGGERIARQQLAVLVGRPPSAFIEQIGQLPEPSTLPAAPAIPNAGVPAHLLLRRPDVRAARRRVEAQDHRVGAAIADQLPRLNLQAAIGLSSPTLQDLLSSFVWSIASSLLTPVLDGGRRAAEVRRNQAVLRERLQGFGQSMLNAMLEVESALARGRQVAVQLQHLEAQLAAARSTLGESRRRYAEGLGDYLPVLTALTTVQTIEQTRVSGQRQLLSQRVQLARALGGAWTTALEPPPLPMPEAEDGE